LMRRGERSAWRSASRPSSRRRHGSPDHGRRSLKAYLFVSPAVVLFIAFIAVPVLGIFVFSFLQWDLLTPPRFAGLSNFRMLGHDPELAHALFNSLLFDIMTTSLHVVVGMGLAIAVTSVRSKIVRYWARTAFVVPFLMSAGAVAVMWSYILSGSTGPFNYYLTRLGMSPPDWLASGTWALPSLVGVDLWQTVGITFIIFLVGLQTIPYGLYEAAAIDGVGPFQRFRYITLPMLSPATLVAATTAFIGAFEVFTWPYVITSGGPGDATLTIMVYIFRVSFRNLELGYGAAVSIVNLVVLVTLVTIGFRFARRWVHYERV
jgi:multiple sugar transport system permease protein